MYKQFHILVLFMLTVSFFIGSDAFENPISSFFPSKEITCYKCSSYKDVGCMNITGAANKGKYEQKCSSNACLKHWIRTDTNEIIIHRDCYYGKMGLFYNNLGCNDVTDNAHGTQRCYKCRGNKCNGTSQRSSMSNSTFYITTTALFIASYLMKI